MKKIVIVGGHLTPALATIEELQKRNIEIIFIGRKYSTEGSSQVSAEFTLVKSKKIYFKNLTAGRLQRKITKHTPISILKIPIGFMQSFFYLLTERPTVVVSFGGYLSTPVVFSAWLLGIPSITHEQASVPGLANKLNSLFVDKIFLAWPECLKYFPKEKTEIIGNPFMRSILASKTNNNKINSFLKNADNLIYITGGNQGSHFLNNLIFKSLRQLSDYKIIHQVGKINFNNDHKKANSIKSKNYLWFDYITSDDLGTILQNTKLVISRSGANIVWELGILGKVSVLIPLPISASGEQKKNAQILEKAGMAKILEQSELTDRQFIKEVKLILRDHNKYQKNAIKFKKTLPLDAAKKLSDKILSYTN